MCTTGVNFRKEKYDVYIGWGSKWGNPFIIGKDGNRKQVIEKHEEWLLGIISAPNNESVPSLKEAMKELLGKKLGCYCKPLDCHGDVLVEMIEKVRK